MAKKGISDASNMMLCIISASQNVLAPLRVRRRRRGGGCSQCFAQKNRSCIVYTCEMLFARQEFIFHFQFFFTAPNFLPVSKP